jgi:hypothetical protein
MLTGRCGCGAVRFETDKPPYVAVYCHCTRCQHRTGSGSQASARFKPGSVRVTEGERHVRAWAPEGGFEKLFCGECGSALFTRDPALGEITGVRMGVIDGDPRIRPSAHQYVAYAAPWEELPDDGLDRYDERMPD